MGDVNNTIRNIENLSQFELIFFILELDEINSKEEFNYIINLLTNHDNPIREAVSLKLEDYILKYENWFLDEFSINKILDGIIDINPNVSRSICKLISSSKTLAGKVEKQIIERINLLILNLKKFEKENNDSFVNAQRNVKNHAKNKKIFSLYWYLEALSCCLSDKYSDEIIKILNYAIDFSDYTIREKTAKLLVKLKNAPLELLQKANSDKNFYVKIQVYDKITMMIS